MKRLLMAAIMVVSTLLVAAPVSAHNPSASAGCFGSYPRVNVELNNYDNGGPNDVSVFVDGTRIQSRTFGEDIDKTWSVGNPYRSHKVVVVVNAWDDPTGSKGWSTAFNLSTPACVARPMSASIVGPCGDPLYRATFRNTSDVQRVGTFVWFSADTNTWHRTRLTLAPNSVTRTSYKHVLGGSQMRAKIDGVTLASEKSAPAGNYGTCRK